MRKTIIELNQGITFPFTITDIAVDKNGKWMVRKSIQYLLNIIKSRPNFSREFYEFYFSLIGPQEHVLHSLISKEGSKDKKLKELFEDRCRARDEDDIARVYLDYFSSLRYESKSNFIKGLIEVLHQRFSSLVCPGKSDIESYIEQLVKMFHLKKSEKKILELIALNSFYIPADTFFVDHLEIQSLLNRKLLSGILSLTPLELKEALSGALVENEIAEYDRRSFCLTEEFVSFHGQTRSSFQVKHLYCKISKPALALQNLILPEELIDHLVVLLQSRLKSPIHILLHGQPGTGKSSLAEAISAHSSNNTYKVLQGVGNSSSGRRAALTACLNMTASVEDRIIIVDEADNLLNTKDSWLFRGETQDKGWLNLFMEKPGVKVIWVVNNIENIEQSVLRRFVFCYRFRPFNQKQRAQLWERILRRHRVKRFFDQQEIQLLAKNYRVSAGSIELAVRTAAEQPEKNKAAIDQLIKFTLSSHLESIHRDRSFSCSDQIAGYYDLSLLNVNHNIQSILNRLKCSKYSILTESQSCSVNLLFYGPPGTGKSELAKYIAYHLNREVVRKRVSDLHSKYLGESEKNIRDAFQEAAHEGSLLVFDEVDSLLYARNRARTSWEVSFTNEFLTQMDNFQGVLICTTNCFEALDHASIRRFQHKIEFNYLDPDGVIKMYHRMISPLVNRKISASQVDALKRISRLAFGDFKNTHDQFSFSTPEELTHNLCIEALKEESRLKKVGGLRQKCGFI